MARQSSGRVTTPWGEWRRAVRVPPISMLALLFVALASAGPAAEPEPKVVAEQASVELARQLLLSGKYAEAQDAYSELAEQHSVIAALGIAECQRQQGDRNGAAKTIQTELDKQPGPPADTTIKRQVADLNARAAELAWERGDQEAAQSHLDAALKSHAEHLLARWLAAEIKRASGQLEAAGKDYFWFVEYYNDHEATHPDELRLIGRAAAEHARWNRLSDQFKFLVNDLYPEALNLDENYWPAHLEAGWLYLEKFNQEEASREFNAALAINPNAAEVHVALAALALQGFNLDAARQSLDRAAEINPELPEIFCYRADCYTANYLPAQAIAELEAARKLNPLSEATLGRLAAAYAAVDGINVAADEATIAAKSPRFAQLLAEVNARNAHAGRFYLTLGESLDLNRKYPAAAHYYREAIARMPQLVAPRGALGAMLMRLGEETEARRLLTESFEIDPYNVRVSNMIKVLEVLDDYAVLETEHFVIRFDRVKDEVLAQAAAKYLEEEVYPQLTKQFGFEPPGKSLFEIFHRARNTSGHGWFSARMVGLPYIGTVGACAGKVVALASPNDMPKKYNWARVLKHEFVHVLNLQQSHFNIPHWYTEALAVLNEEGPRPQAWTELLAARLAKQEVFNLDDINLGFVRPKSSDDWTLAYCQAELYAEYLVATHGPDSLGKLLNAYADNLDTRAALKHCFGVEQAEFEQGYSAFIKNVAASAGLNEKPAARTFAQLQRAWDAKPDDPELAAQLALEQVRRKSYPQARKLADRALAQQPGHPLATYVLARLRLVVGEEAEAIALLESCVAPTKKPLVVEPLNLLASLKLKQRDFAQAEKLYQLGAEQEPHNDQWTKSLARVYLLAGDEVKLGAALARLAELDGDDLTIRKKLVALAQASQDHSAVEKWANQALRIDVLDADLHHAAGQSLLTQATADELPLEQQRQIASRAAQALAAAVQLATTSPDALDADLPGWQYQLAQALAKAGNTADARTRLEKLLQEVPDHADGKKLLETLKP